jgi:hypothetical protein
MKMVDEAKASDESSPSNAGEYTQEDLEEMLEMFVKVKQIESDPKKLKMLRDFATSREQTITDLFDVNNVPPVKSLKDLKKIYNDKVEKEQESE